MSFRHSKWSPKARVPHQQVFLFVVHVRPSVRCLMTVDENTVTCLTIVCLLTSGLSILAGLGRTGRRQELNTDVFGSTWLFSNQRGRLYAHCHDTDEQPPCPVTEWSPHAWTKKNSCQPLFSFVCFNILPQSLASPSICGFCLRLYQILVATCSCKCVFCECEDTCLFHIWKRETKNLLNVIEERVFCTKDLSAVWMTSWLHAVGANFASCSFTWFEISGGSKGVVCFRKGRQCSRIWRKRPEFLVLTVWFVILQCCFEKNNISLTISC